MAGFVQPVAAAQPVVAPTPAAAMTAAGAKTAVAKDVALDGFGDAAGYHVQVAAGSGWRQIAVLRPAGLDPSSWVGYQCLSGDGKYAGVAVLPASSVNIEQARDRGAFAYSVDIASGAVHSVASGVGLKYFSPGCGVGDDAVFTSNLGSDDAQTVLTTADLATGAVRTSITVAGQVTSAVPTSAGVLGVAGSALVSISPAGRAAIVAQVTGDAYQVRPAADGGVTFLTTTPSGQVATVHHEKSGKVTDLGSGPRTRLQLFQGRGGKAVLTGATAVAGSAAGSVAVASDKGLPQGASAASLDGGLLVGTASGGSAKAAGGEIQVAPATGATATVPGAAATGSSTTATSSSGSVKPTTAVPTYVPPAVAKNALAPAAPTRSGLKPGAGAAPAAFTFTPGSSTVTAAPAVLNVSTGAVKVETVAAQTPICAVAPGDVTKQVMQPSTAQVDWAAEMAEQGLLVGSAYSRPANWQNQGWPAYAPNTDFPLISLSHPAGTSATTVPRVVYEAIMAQESNYDQASWHAPEGNAGDPLIADYYGAAGDIVSINYAGADCGYGIGQVTDGMHIGDHSLSARGQLKVALDYQDNIAAGLQILEGKWNQLYTAGIIGNNGDPQYLENWYFAAWAYNGGVQPGSAYNSTGCTPGPSCTGPDGTWGLGWTNNPDNLDYPPSRAPYLQTSYADAAHPGNWPYQERVMGWMASPIIRYGSAAYTPPTYHGGQAWLQIPAFGSFCTLADNNCDPVHTNTSNPGASHCMYNDFECWWHKPLTWVSSCATTCATSPYTVSTGSVEPANPNLNPPTCSIDNSKVAANAIVVDDEASPPVNLQGCGTPNWSQGGTFTMAPGTNSAGDPIGQIDIHQLGVGLGGHVWFSHTEDGSNPNEINTGTWTPTLPSLQYYTIKIHLPSIGATATNVVYTINPGGSATPWKIRVNQDFGSEQWATIGTFAMQNGGSVSLSNQSAVVIGTGQHAYNFDVAWDAVAFVPQGGTPGTPIGGPPTVQDEPHGSNPSWLQCGCAKRTAGDPVDTSTGYFSDTFTDLSTPGRGLPLTFTRSYAGSVADPTGPNATLAADGPFGYGWTFNYNMTAATDGSGNVTITQEDRSQVVFNLAAGIYSTTAPRFDATLTKTGSTYTFTRSGRELFTFDTATGHLTAETSLAGSAANPAYWTTLAYNASGQLSTITDPAGRTYTLTWTGAHITALTDSAGRQVSYAYNTAGDLTDVYGVATTRTPSLLSNDRYTYTYVAGKHLIASMRTPNNYTAAGGTGPGATSMTYDSSDRVLTQTDPMSEQTTFTYGPASSPSLVAGQTLTTDPAGHKTLDTYSNGLLTSETKGYNTPDAGTWSYTYDPVSLGVSTESDPDGNLQTFSYDTHGNQISASNALGYTTLSTYDDHGDLLESVDPTGVAAVNQYDQSGHVVDPASTGRFTAAGPTRILDTTTGVGVTGDVPSHASISLQVAGVAGVPATGVTAVVVNLQAVNPTTAGYITAYPGGSTRPLAANVAFPAGPTVASLATIPVGPDGTISLYNGSTATLRMVGDLAGYFQSAGPAAAGFTPAGPTRILDTTTGVGVTGDVPSHASISLQVAGVAGVPATGVTAVVVSLQAVTPTSTGYITAYPDGSTRPLASNVAFPAGPTVVNLAVVPVGPDGKIALYNGGTTTLRMVGDLAGYFQTGTAGTAGFTPAGPTRILDTTTGVGVTGDVPSHASISLQVAGVAGVPATGVTAVVVDLQAVSPTTAGYITAYPSGSTRPLAANVAFPAGPTVTDLAVVPLGPDGKISLYNGSTATLRMVGDQAGYFQPTPSTPGNLPYGDLTSTTVTQANNVVESTTGNFGPAPARTTNYYYGDPAHPADLTKTLDPNNHASTATYDSFGDQVSTTDAAGDVSKAGYNTGTGQLTSTVTGNGVAAGIAPGCTPPANGCTTYLYNAFNQLTQTTDPLGHTSKATYDADGDTLTSVDGNNKSTTIGYDAADRPILVTKADSTTNKTDYNLDSTVADTVDGLGNKTLYSYDGQGRAVSSTDPDHRTSTITLDPAGRLTTSVDALSRTVTPTLDAAGEITHVAYSDGVTPAVSYTYDADGRVLTMTDGTGTTSNSYDTYGEITASTNAAGATVGYSYDPAGNVTGITYPGQAVSLVRGFDSANRLTSIKDFAGNSTTFGYDHDSALTSTVYPDGATVANTLNNAEQLTGTTATKGATALVTLGYGRDNAGQISSQTVAGTSQSFGYTSREQLGSTTGGATGTGGTASFAMDAADHPTTVGAATQTFDPAGQQCWSITTAVTTPTCGTVPTGATTYTFDGVGDRTKTTPATGTASTYTYNQAQQLTAASTPSGSGTYTYNGAGLRTSKTVAGVTINYTWDQAEELLTDGTNTYIYGPDGQPLEQTSTAGTYYFVHDQIGSTRTLLDSTGAVAASYTYTPYGIATHTGTANTALQYTGQYLDTETGLYYLRARYYDPTTAQFLTIDPLLAQTGTPYAYVGGNPANGADPTGQDDPGDDPGGGDDEGDLVADPQTEWQGRTGEPETAGFVYESIAQRTADIPTEAVDDTPTDAAISADDPDNGMYADAFKTLDGTPCEKTTDDDAESPETAATSSRSVDEVLSSLPKGKQGFVRTVPDDQTLQTTFDDLTRGAQQISRSGYDGPVYELPDGTQIGLRGGSKSGGRTIDIQVPGQDAQKIHIG